jgi:predicted PhzF superfamily epimerase YddE/YHI9
VASETTLRSATPDFKRLALLPVRGIIVTSQSEDPRFDFVSRFFAPASGVDEDPATGSAHCCLGAYWRKRLGKTDFVAYQASARGGIVKVRIVNDRAYLGGNAITVAKGELVVEANEP